MVTSVTLVAMSYDDLPNDWPSRPLTDPVFAADVIDLVVRESDRIDGAVCALLCRPDFTMLQPVLVADIPDEPSPPACRAFLDLVLTGFGPEVGAVILALGRAAGTVPTDTERTWHQVTIDICREKGVPLLAAYLATCDGVTELPRHDIAA